MKIPIRQLTFRSVFVLLFVLEAFLFLWQFLTQRISAGHETIQYFILQYYFLNHLICHGEIAQWMPYMTQGTVANWWFSIQADLFQNALMTVHPLLRNLNFVDLFNFGIFWKHLVLLCGVWLWGRIHLKSPWAVLFFCSGILGSAIWMNQIWYGFHLYYALPLVFFLIHYFLKTWSWRWLFLAGQLWILQSFGNMPYFLPLTAWILFSYFLLYLSQNFKTLDNGWKNLDWKKGILVIAALVLTAWGYVYLTTYGTKEIINYNPGRNLEGTTDLNGFLTYGGILGINAWIEGITGISPMLDYTLYSGFLITLFALAGLVFIFSLKNRAWLLIWTILVIFLNLACWPSSWLYELWPMMKFYRHLSLLTPLSKVAVCLWSAVVLDHLLEQKLDFHQIRKFSLLAGSMALAILVLILCSPGIIKLALASISPSMFFSEVPIFLDRILPHFQAWGFFHSLIIGLALGAFIILLIHPQQKTKILIILILIQCIDIYSYKIKETLARTVSNQTPKITKFYPMPYAGRRSFTDWEKLERSHFIQQLPLQTVKNWAINSFIYLDEPGSTFRVDHWLKPLDQYYRTYWGQNLDDFKERPAGLINYRGLTFPQQHPASLKFSGVNENKIQFFTDGDEITDIKQTSLQMSLAHYSGDVPFILKSGEGERRINLKENYRIDVPIKIRNFTANRLEISADVPAAAKWLIYSDVWHPDWQATDNGSPIKIYRANLAYKAIPVTPGQHVIEFHFFSRVIDLLYWLLAFISLAWVIGIIWLTHRLIHFPK